MKPLLLSLLTLIAALVPAGLAVDGGGDGPDGAGPGPAPVRVACLGDSITFGAGSDAPERDGYPAQLASVLGAGYEVRNFGVGGTTLLFEGDRPYRRQPQFQAAIEFDPDVVLLLFGANDTCGAPRNNWSHSASFTSDARALIQSLRRPGRRLIVALPSPFYPTTPGLTPERKVDLEERNPRLDQIRGWWRDAAQAEGAEVVNLAGALAPDPRLTTDGVHLTRAGYAEIARRIGEAVVGKPGSPRSSDAAPGHSPSAIRKVPESAFAKALVWHGVAIEEANYTIWGASPIAAEGRFHLFAARWPEANVDPAWRKSSEIAHYIADRPEGPFRFRETVLKGSGRTGDWDAFAPHNPEIQRFGDQFALCYIANSDFHQPPHPLNQRIGMVVSHSIDGPWKKVGQDGLILGPSSDPAHFSHGRQVVNPALLKVGNKFHLYYKTRGVDGTLYGLAIADELTGPYRMLDRPLTTKGVYI